MKLGRGKRCDRMKAVEMTKIRLCAIQKMMKILKKSPRMFFSILLAVEFPIENQLIADAAHGLHAVLVFLVLAQFSPQPADVHVKASIKGIEGAAEHRPADNSSRLSHLAGGPHEGLQQPELDVGQVKLSAGF